MFDIPSHSNDRSDLRAFIQSSSMSSAQLAYIPPTTSEHFRPLVSSQSVTLSRSSTPSSRPKPLHRSSSFSNLLRVFRRPSLPVSTDTPSTAGDLFQVPRSRADIVLPKLDIPQRSASLPFNHQPAIINTSLTPLCPPYSPRRDHNEPFGGLDFAAELQDTFKEWEQKFRLKRASSEDPSMSPVIYTSPPSPTCTNLLTPGPTTCDTLSPLRSEFSCDSDDDERAEILDLVRIRDLQKASPGSIGRLTRKMSSAIALGIAQKSPLGRRMGLGPRRETA